ncbi:MAG: multidrug efflux transporter permease subunit, partial [Tardiphaga sp.]|nr:multidrug efflux transporter permease subunit [Tardiphaga sp.]
GGMIAVVILALLMVPVFFVAIQRLFSRDKDVKSDDESKAEVYGPAAPAQGASH